MLVQKCHLQFKKSIPTKLSVSLACSLQQFCFQQIGIFLQNKLSLKIFLTKFCSVYRTFKHVSRKEVVWKQVAVLAAFVQYKHKK